MWKLRDIEQKVWTDELADMRRLVNDELHTIRQMAAGLLPTSDQTSDPPSYLCGGLDSQEVQDGDADSEDGGFDIDSVKLNLGCSEDPPVPELYLSQSPSPAIDGGQSLSW